MSDLYFVFFRLSFTCIYIVNSLTSKTDISLRSKHVYIEQTKNVLNDCLPAYAMINIAPQKKIFPFIVVVFPEGLNKIEKIVCDRHFCCVLI